MKHFFNTTRNENILESILKNKERNNFFTRNENSTVPPPNITINIEDVNICVYLFIKNENDLIMSSIENYKNLDKKNILNSDVNIQLIAFKKEIISDNKFDLYDSILNFQRGIDGNILSYMYFNYDEGFNLDSNNLVDFNELYYNIIISLQGGIFFEKKLYDNVRKIIYYLNCTNYYDNDIIYMFKNVIVEPEEILYLTSENIESKMEALKIKNFKFIDVANNKSEETSNNSTKIINSITIPSYISRTLKEIKNDVKMIKSMF